MNTIRRLLLALLLALPVFASAQVDINSADAKTLARSMNGVGLVKAEAIVAYRNANGPFDSVDDLAKVKGIGTKTIDANRGAIVAVRAPGATSQAGATRPDGGRPPAAP